jgi:hypothetical protein
METHSKTIEIEKIPAKNLKSNPMKNEREKQNFAIWVRRFFGMLIDKHPLIALRKGANVINCPHFEVYVQHAVTICVQL